MLLSRENKNVISAFSVLPSHTLRIYLFLLVSFIIKEHIFSILDLLKKKKPFLKKFIILIVGALKILVVEEYLIKQ